MQSTDLALLVPNPDDLLALPVYEQGRLILKLLASYDGPRNPIAHSNFFNRANDILDPPKYGNRQREVDQALMEAWSWLESCGFLSKSPSSAGNWVFVGKAGKEFLNHSAGFATGEKLRHIGQPMGTGKLSLVADTRLAELSALATTQFDYRKLIRLCEEINTVYREECYFATAMLTRGLLDHVPPIFGKQFFNDVANGYGGGGKSFKDAMNQLENAARKIADAHLHQLIRKKESLPTAQQVNFAPQLDALLSEIVRISS